MKHIEQALSTDDERSNVDHIEQGPGRYGLYYWCIKVPKRISKTGEIYLNADSIEINDSGTLIVQGGFREKYSEAPKRKMNSMAFSPGNWICFYAASCMDGSPVCVNAW